jgi:hypothetical protein
VKTLKSGQMITDQRKNIPSLALRDHCLGDKDTASTWNAFLTSGGKKRVEISHDIIYLPSYAKKRKYSIL